ncbi:GNAT family N-acetyltransferase [Lysinibacillus sp. SGAir0095]|uniref:GNAT family N-acetyltransferase n=1 Tax=Lysinibacillus sp. SGAir0095 TaxID=2070463 RepID=UPI0010CD5236|nr:GNAT family N-acetyltransferase [Lysinibacillus sp. SGAir0095]QCR32567.1 N-acetyltransferase [Lysinibacillus sp. SGAir0095]
MLEVKLIEAEDTYSLRHRILRPHMEIKDCMYDTDHGEGAFHVGAFVQNQLISIASFNIEKYYDFPHENQYRLRGMATRNDFRKQGAGREIIRFAEKLIKANDTNLLWCNARTTVQDYYLKIGFQAHGEAFDYPPIGPHIVMYKKIESL